MTITWPESRRTGEHRQADHPDRCDLGPSCVGKDDDSSVDHHLRPTSFWPEDTDTRIALSATWHTDFLNGVDHGGAGVELKITEDAQDLAPALVSLTPRDARYLARQLKRYAREAEGLMLWYSQAELEEGQ